MFSVTYINSTKASDGGLTGVFERPFSTNTMGSLQSISSTKRRSKNRGRDRHENKPRSLYIFEEGLFVTGGILFVVGLINVSVSWGMFTLILLFSIVSYVCVHQYSAERFASVWDARKRLPISRRSRRRRTSRSGYPSSRSNALHSGPGWLRSDRSRSTHGRDKL